MVSASLVSLPQSQEEYSGWRQRRLFIHGVAASWVELLLHKDCIHESQSLFCLWTDSLPPLFPSPLSLCFSPPLPPLSRFPSPSPYHLSVSLSLSLPSLGFPLPLSALSLFPSPSSFPSLLSVSLSLSLSFLAFPLPPLFPPLEHPSVIPSRLQVLRKADMVRKNAVESVQRERNILVSVRSPFVVRPLCLGWCLTGGVLCLSAAPFVECDAHKAGITSGNTVSACVMRVVYGLGMQLRERGKPCSSGSIVVPRPLFRGTSSLPLSFLLSFPPSLPSSLQ